MNGEMRILLEMLDEAYDRRSWHGPNLRGSLRGVSAAEAALRPAPGRHTIWELVLHTAYWKYAVRRRLREEKRGSFTLKGSNWFVQEQKAARDWKGSLALLAREHGALRQAVASLPPASLRKKASGSTVSRLTLVRGIAAHDLYHAGQIQLVKRLIRR